MTLSPASVEMPVYLRQPYAARKPVGYNRDFLDSCQPSVTFYLSEQEQASLAAIGTLNFAAQAAAGTYAKQLLSRLLIDLSWNASRLEGNSSAHRSVLYQAERTADMLIPTANL